MYVIGFICEFNEKIVKIYDFKNKLVTVPNTAKDGELMVGKYYHVTNNGFEKRKKDNKFGDNVQLDVEDGRNLIIYTWAVSPETDLPDKIRQKYEGKVWSPYFDFLDDPKKLFGKQFNGGEKGWVTLKYAPNRGTVFEIVGAHHSNPNGVFTKLPPWKADMGMELPIDNAKNPSERVLKFSKSSTSIVIDYALCIGTNCHNPMSVSQEWANSKFEKCNHLFGSRNGTIRWIIHTRTSRSDKVFGKWFTHKINLNSRYNRGNSQHNTTFKIATATNAIQIDDPLPTRVVDGEIEVDTSFIYEDKMLESDLNKTVKNWDSRFRGLKKDAYFWSEYLGKVEIHQQESKNILEIIERDQQLVGYKNPRTCKPDQFVIFVTVTPLHDYEENIEKYPAQGLFMVKTIRKIEKNDKPI